MSFLAPHFGLFILIALILRYLVHNYVTQCDLLNCVGDIQLTSSIRHKMRVASMEQQHGAVVIASGFMQSGVSAPLYRIARIVFLLQRQFWQLKEMGFLFNHSAIIILPSDNKLCMLS